MNPAVAAFSNSTIVRFYSSSWLAILRTYFGVASRLLPRLARRHAEQLFTTPPRYAGRQTHPVDARRETVVAGRHSIAVWEAGRAGAPAVLVAHGWGGAGVQMGSFVEPLLAKGFRVVWFDHPGHGESGRAEVALPDFVRAIEAISTTHGPFAGAIGHSLGAAAIGVGLRRGLRFGRVAFVASPASISEHAHRFARWVGITPTIREAMRRRLERRYGVRFAEIDRIEDLQALHLPALFVHDTGDSEVPFEHALRLSSRMAGARLVKTYGLGHYRILRDRAVVDAIVGFVAGNDDVPPELPVLPRPAPLY